ncbi:MAG: 16S rRNA (cytosine(1402)-N(4))-methyltransferase RsmH [Acidimicrobiia bacterium]|nr:16S rRNA (cytosine(1402)-N(4))-methyltransferase RsmH [Acidimicrobiia bacterium]
MSRKFGHQPVLVGEVVDLLRPAGGGLVVDATVGGGGHARAILDALGGTTRLIGIDKDEAALSAAGESLSEYGSRVALRRGDFRTLADLAEREEVASVQAVLADLGVSSPQLDWADRGFSVHQDAPLDMRMDRTAPLTAAAVVNDYDEEALARLIARYGEERFARRIAAAIVAARVRAPIRTTTELAAIVTAAIPAATRRSGRHPARRTFQALRIEVNDELGALADLLAGAPDLLAPGGVFAVISYHSLEDRMVKRAFRARGLPAPAPHGMPVAPGPTGFEILTPKVIRPSAAEQAANPRSQSARLRALGRRRAAAA